MVDLVVVGMMEDIDLNWFYDILIEVKWTGGQEILRLSMDCVNWIEPEGKKHVPLSDQSLEQMKDLGIEQRKILP